MQRNKCMSHHNIEISFRKTGFTWYNFFKLHQQCNFAWSGHEQFFIHSDENNFDFKIVIVKWRREHLVIADKPDLLCQVFISPSQIKIESITCHYSTCQLFKQNNVPSMQHSNKSIIVYISHITYCSYQSKWTSVRELAYLNGSDK